MERVSEYYGFNIELETYGIYEGYFFALRTGDNEKSMKSTTLKGVKELIDAFLEVNAGFEPFDVVLCRNGMIPTYVVSVFGVNEDGEFIGKYKAEGDTRIIEVYEESYYIAVDARNESIIAKLQELDEKQDEIIAQMEDLTETIHRKTLQEFRVELGIAGFNND